MVEYIGKLISRELQEAIENSPDYRLLNETEKAKYTEFVSANFSSKKAREILNRESNIFKIVGLNQIGIRTATLPELELVVEDDPSFLKDHYENAQEVVLRSAGDSYNPNDAMAKSLAKAIGKNGKFKVPFILSGFKLNQTDNSDYAGLTIVPGDNFKYLEAPDFSHKNNKRQFRRVNPDYTIEWCKEGKEGRTFYSKENGLSGAGFYGDLGLNSLWDCLGGSDSDGRVVVVDASGAEGVASCSPSKK